MATTPLPEEYVRLFELIPDPLWIDRRKSLVLVNSALVKLLRADCADQIIGKAPFDIIHPDYHEMILKRIPIALATDTKMPVVKEKLVRFDGTAVDVEVTAARFELLGEPSIIAIFRDITDRLQHEDAMRRTQVRQKLVVDLLERTRSASSVEEAQRETVSMIGEFLNASRCMYSEFNVDEDTLIVYPDWTRGVQSLAGSYRLSTFWPLSAPGWNDRTEAGKLLGSGKTFVVSDTKLDPRTGNDYYEFLEPKNCRAFLSVPLVKDDRICAVLGVHCDRPREWHADEIEIVEAAAARTWLTIETVRLRQREHHIAETLQRSLIELPEENAFPGLSICTEYEPSLVEADVGGDFLDVFAVDEGRVALVVGDVSGKGLAAAARTAESRYVSASVPKARRSAACCTHTAESIPNGLAGRGPGSRLGRFRLSCRGGHRSDHGRGSCGFGGSRTSIDRQVERGDHPS